MRWSNAPKIAKPPWDGWHLWFAWYPVECGGEWVWWEWVKRRIIKYPGTPGSFGLPRSSVNYLTLSDALSKDDVDRHLQAVTALFRKHLAGTS